MTRDSSFTAVLCDGTALSPAPQPRTMKPHELEQGLAQLRDSLPRMWKALYDGAVQAGFEPAVALGLVQTHILSQNPRGICPPPGHPDKEPDQ